MKKDHTTFDVEVYLNAVEDDRCGNESNIVPIVTTGKGEGSLHTLPFSSPGDPESVLGVVRSAEARECALSEENASILIAGSSKDRQVAHLMNRLKKQHFISLLTGPDTLPSSAQPPFTWALENDKLWVHRVEVRPKAAFVRYNFHAETDYPDPATVRRTHAWHSAVTAWVAAHPDVRTFNRHQRVMFWHKPAVLHLAGKVGLKVPETVFSNDIDALRRPDGVIKPIDGRGYCQSLDHVVSGLGPDQLCAHPVAVQHRMDYSELRVYAVGKERFGVSIRSNALDYRTSDLGQEDLKPAEVPKAVSNGLGELMDLLGLDFCAADFKTLPGSPGQYVLLDVNDAPMFADCDAKLGGAITRSMLKFLLAP